MPQGFSDAAGWAGFAPETAQSSGPSGPVFPSTGPHGHRSRMRDRLIERGAAGMADYEVLEMLFFLGIPRRDTKPLAKATINRFGSLAAVVATPPRTLLAVPGITPACTEALDLVRLAAGRLAAAEPRHMPVLSDWETLRTYLSSAGPAALRVLHLDNKNRLLADDVMAGAGLDTPSTREILRRALELQAVSLLLASTRPGAAATRSDKENLARLRRDAAAVAVGVHDHVLLDGATMISLAQALRG